MGLTPSNIMEARLLKSFRNCIDSLYINQKFAENENISINDGDILKPDFVLYAPETESMVIVELKNLAGPSRQAGTELSAYTSEIRSAIPFLSDGDVVHVLISPEWPTLLKHYVQHEIFWQGKNLICLQPVDCDGSIKLEILGLTQLSNDATSFKISERHLGGYQMCLYDDLLYGENPDRSRLDAHIEQFKAALHAMAVAGSRVNSHGFAMLWKDRWSGSLAPYSITIMNFAPFQSVERFLHLDPLEIPEMVKRFFLLVKENDPEGHGNAISAVTDAGERLLENVCSPRVEGFAHWGAHRKIMEHRAEHVAFVGWGLFGEALFSRLQAEYDAGNITCSINDPGLGLSVVADIVDDSYEFVDLSYLDFDVPEPRGDER